MEGEQQAEVKKVSTGFHEVTTVELAVGVGSVLGSPATSMILLLYCCTTVVVCVDIPFTWYLCIYWY